MNVKIRNGIVTGLIILVTLVLIRQNGSLKGNWSESDKQRFREELENIPELYSKILGKNKSKFIEYCIASGEKNYSSFSELSHDSEGLQKISKESCVKIISNGSVKGKWSESDKQRFRRQLVKEEGVIRLGVSKTNWIECCLNKIEANYSSYVEAIKDLDGGEKLALGCNDEMLLRNNNK